MTETTQTAARQEDSPKWYERLTRIDRRTHGLIIRQDAVLDYVGPVKGDQYHEPGKGKYAVQPGQRLFLRRKLRPGTYYLWPEGDPWSVGPGGQQQAPVEPITGRHSLDDIARLLDTMTGGYLPFVVGDAHRDAATIPAWIKWGAAAAGAVGAVAVAYLYATGRLKF